MSPNRHNIPSDGHFSPHVLVMSSASSQRVFLTIDAAGLSASFHLTRLQVAQLIDALREADNELAAREVERVSS